MPKRFCVTGTCIPEKNYMVDISGRIDRIIRDYIEKGQYFTINRARQYGKTTTLYLLERRLREEYIVLSLSFEAADEYFESMGSLAEGLVMDISECLKCRWYYHRGMESSTVRAFSDAFIGDKNQFFVQDMWKKNHTYD